MVAQFMQDAVNQWLAAGQAPNNEGFIRDWLGRDPNSAYSQLYKEWAAPYQQRLYREQETARQAQYDQQLAALQQTFQGTLSGISQQYGQQQNDVSQQWATQLANIQNQYNTQLSQYQQQSQSQLGQLQAELERLSQPSYTTVDYGFKGVGEDYQRFNTQKLGVDDLYRQGSGLLSKFAPDQLGSYGERFNTLNQGYINAVQNYRNLEEQGVQRYGSPQQYNTQEAPSRYAEYAAYNQNLSSARQGVLSYLTDLSNLSQNAYSTGTALEGQTRQRRLTERNQWFAGEAQRNANLVSMRAEQRQGRSMGRQRQAVASSSNPYGLLSSQNLTR